MQNLISDNYEYYLEFLRELISMPSEFSKPEDVKKAIEYCKKIFEENLSNYDIYFDEEYNLIAVPPNIDSQKEIVYLSAHIDTVGAKADEWNHPYKPWEFHEDEKELVARGVNDCKAGVAYQLFLSFLAKKGLIKLNNIVFTITFKEEGAGNKTSKAIAKQMGTKLAISEQSTYMIVLENNVHIKTPPVMCVYTSERSNYVIKIIDFIPELKKYINKLSKWNPVSITPQKEIEHMNYEIIEQTGGHVCSVTRDKNKLTQAILDSNKNSVIQAGEEKNFATIPTKILMAEEQESIKHVLVLNNRSFDSMEEVLKQIDGIEYETVKDFSVSQGFNIDDKFSTNEISKILENCKNNSEIEIEYTYNVGGSDGSIVYGFLTPKIRKNFYPIVMGPGSRSQRNISPPRLTHGKNETFDKENGKKAIIFISSVLERMSKITG